MDEKEKLKDIIKKLEGVYKISTDLKQKERVKGELSRLKQELKKLEELSEETILTEDENIEKLKKVSVIDREISDSDIAETEEDNSAFPLLSQIEIEKIHSVADDPEIDMTATYLRKFEDELWGALSDFNLKLDYNHSRERYKFYDYLENCQRLLRDYIKILDEIADTNSDKYKERLRLMKVKVGRAFLITTTEFMIAMNEFTNCLINDYNNNGNIILNPNDVIKISKLGGENKELDGKTVIDTLKYVAEFTDEFVQKIKLPEEILTIKKKNK